jgi:uncharacterized protein
MTDNSIQVSLTNTEALMFPSSHIDQTYKIFVSLPDGYTDSDETYPILYMTDANWFFSIFHPATRFLPVPPMIVVGIGYPTDDFNEISTLRARDFLPTKDATGGGPNFLLFIREELFPFIESQYRVNADDRTFWGYSYGGTFGVYTLFNQLDIFKRYIIGAPTLIWDDRLCFAYERKHAEQNDDLDTQLYLCVGTADEDLVEHNTSLLFEFHAILKNRKYTNLDMDLGVFLDDDHLTGIMPCIQWGLVSAFK